MQMSSIALAIRLAERANIKLCFRGQRCDNIVQILVRPEQVPQRDTNFFHGHLASVGGVIP
jgi:hypothetical protein